jgi:predicted CXXCH cytochrome family protein
MRDPRRIFVGLLLGVIAVLPGGRAAFAPADEKRSLPDHSSFETCGGCHADKKAEWEASNHGKAVRAVAEKKPDATDCSGCHSTRRGTEGSGAGRGDYHKPYCLACHDPKNGGYERKLRVDREKLCDLCHAQRSVFLGKGAKGITDSRNFHSGVPCVSCHMTEGNHRMKVLRPDDAGLTEKRPDTCTACHMDDNREARVSQIQEWQSTYDESMAPLLAEVKEIEALLAKKEDLPDARLKSRLEDVKHNLSILEKDGSRGFHNFVFLLEISSLAASDLKEIKAGIGQGAR